MLTGDFEGIELIFFSLIILKTLKNINHLSDGRGDKLSSSLFHDFVKMCYLSHSSLDTTYYLKRIIFVRRSYLPYPTKCKNCSDEHCLYLVFLSGKLMAYFQIIRWVPSILRLYKLKDNVSNKNIRLIDL